MLITFLRSTRPCPAVALLEDQQVPRKAGEVIVFAVASCERDCAQLIDDATDKNYVMPLEEAVSLLGSSVNP